MTMALAGIGFNAHKRNGMFKAIQEPMQVAPNVKGNYALIVPIPDHIARTSFYGLGSNIPWDS